MASKPPENNSRLKANFKFYTPAIIFILDNYNGQSIEIAVRRSIGETADR
jgi:hypothetical protein